jgi:hypothetical protein
MCVAEGGLRSQWFEVSLSKYVDTRESRTVVGTFSMSSVDLRRIVGSMKA